jgi:hypothetical protein
LGGWGWRGFLINLYRYIGGHMDKKEVGLKLVPRAIKDKTIREAIETSSRSFSFKDIPNGGSTATIICNSEAEAEKTLTNINVACSRLLNTIIEKETGEDSKLYHRTLTLFEVKNVNGTLILTWS